MNANWILKNGVATTDCASFPFAFRTAFNLVRKAIEAKKDPTPVIKDITILGPVNGKGERTKYSYDAAAELAKGQGLLTPDGTINSREFKKR
jgi:hypothetical protein